MTRLPLGAALLCSILPFDLLAQSPSPSPRQTEYALTADSKVQPGVPQGELLKFTFDQSKVFPGTTRQITVYVPKQYDPKTPACVYVSQDGGGFNAQTVFDNLIAKKELPVIIGIFIRPGVMKALTPNSLDRFNRSLEYDDIGPDYVRFLLDEIFPAVEKLSTADGRPIHLSRSGNDHAIGGASSGAIAAFTAAWQRPDAFTRVFSAIGTYTALRGGNEYPILIRKTEPKPIRIFQQDGSADLNSYGGDWWMANQEMERALTFAGYEHDHVWGDNGHSGKQGAEYFPDAMRFLWKDWPDSVKAGESKNQVLHAILIPGETWTVASDGHQSTGALTVNAKGEVLFTDIPKLTTYKIGLDGKVEEAIAGLQTSGGAAFGPDGKLSFTRPHPIGAELTPLARGTTLLGRTLLGADMVIRHDGSVYVTKPNAPGAKEGPLEYISPTGDKKLLPGTSKSPTGITLSPDQSLLYVGEAGTPWIDSYQILADGTLANREHYFYLHTAPGEVQSTYAMCCDTDGRLYVATTMGIQVCDQAGRVNCILPIPNGIVTSLTFGGPNLDTLYTASGATIYKRRLKVKAALPFNLPVEPIAPHM